MTDCYITRENSTVMLTGIIDRPLAEEIAINHSAINPGYVYVIHGTNGHAGWLIATAADGKLTPARPVIGRPVLDTDTDLIEHAAKCAS